METKKLVNEVRWLVACGWDEAKAIKHVAAKYDVADWELAYYILGI